MSIRFLLPARVRTSLASKRIGAFALVCLCLPLIGCGAINRITGRRTLTPEAVITSLPPNTPLPANSPAATSVAPTPTAIASTAAPTVPVPVSGGPARLIGTYVPPLDAPKYCQEMASYDARFTWTAIPWDGIEPAKGVFVWKRADQIIMALHNCGFDIGIHILSRNAWATQPVPNIPSKAIASMPPKDMNEYYNFVFQLASHYKGIISRYSIENEAHASSNWPSSPESYFQMLAVAYRAIHAADPNAIVEDSAISSSGLGVLYANDLLKAGKKQEAIDFLHNYFATFSPPAGHGEPITVNSEQDMNNLLNQPEVQRLLAWAPMLFDDNKYYDVEQLHYFGPWSDLPAIMGWVHSQLKARGTDKPLELWEMGYAWTNVNTFDPKAQARDVPKYMAVAIGEGGLRALSWLFTDIAFQAEGHPGLIGPNGPRPAAESFKVVANALNSTTNSERLSLGAGVWGYRYDKSSGSVYALWSDQPTKIKLPIPASSVTVTDITGKVTTANPDSLDVSDSPIFVTAK